jgi:hypothetical protein
MMIGAWDREVGMLWCGSRGEVAGMRVTGWALTQRQNNK